MKVIQIHYFDWLEALRWAVVGALVASSAFVGIRWWASRRVIRWPFL